MFCQNKITIIRVSGSIKATSLYLILLNIVNVLYIFQKGKQLRI